MIALLLAAAALSPLSSGEIANVGRGCQMTQNGQIVMATNYRAAVFRFAGRLRNVVVAEDILSDDQSSTKRFNLETNFTFVGLDHSRLTVTPEGKTSRRGDGRTSTPVVISVYSQSPALVSDIRGILIC